LAAAGASSSAAGEHNAHRWALLPSMQMGPPGAPDYAPPPPPSNDTLVSCSRRGLEVTRVALSGGPAGCWAAWAASR